jgi:hypothetical protein
VCVYWQCIPLELFPCSAQSCRCDWVSFSFSGCLSNAVLVGYVWVYVVCGCCCCRYGLDGFWGGLFLGVGCVRRGAILVRVVS